MICFCVYVETPNEKFIIFEVANMVELGTEFEKKKVLLLALLVASHFNKCFNSTQLKLIKLSYNFLLNISFLLPIFKESYTYRKSHKE